MSKLKVLQLTKFYPPFWGGIESVTFEITEWLYHNGYDVEVICANTSTKTVVETYNNKYKVTRCGSLGRLFSTSISFSLIAHVIKHRNKHDVIHVHLPDPLSIVALLIANSKSKVVVHWHSDIVKQTFLLRIIMPLVTWILKRSDLIIGTSPKYINESKQLTGFRHKCTAIPIGTSLKAEVDKNRVKEIRDKYEGKSIVFSLGRLVYYKGFEYLIQSAQYIDIVVIIGGEGPLRNKLQNLITQLKLQNKVFLLSKIPAEDLINYYHASDIFCLPSIHYSEAFGVVQIEAMMCGLPVVSTNIEYSGVSWVNEHGTSGLTVKPQSAEELSEAFKLILNDNSLKKILQEGSHRRYKQLFTPEKMGQLIDEQYNKIILKRMDKPDDNKPLVSIITVLLDNKNYIRDAIESVLSQTYNSIEYIIIDGDSKDGSIEIIRSYGNKISKFISEPDNGVYDALNKGIKLANGEIIGILHSDDFFEDNNIIKEIVDEFNITNCEALYGNLRYVHNTVKEKIVRVWKAGYYNPARFYWGWMPPHPTFYAKRSVYERYGLFNTTLKFAADYELMLRFILKNQIRLHYFNKFIVRMRVGGASNRSLTNRIKANLEDRKAWRINEIKPGILSLLLKPFSKIFQYRFN